MATIDDFKNIEIRIGKILEAERIPESEKMLKLRVDFGEEESRQVLTGIGPYVEDLGTLIGMQCPFVTNLPPRTMLGLESQAMILCVTHGDHISFLKSDSIIPPGTRIS